MNGPGFAGPEPAASRRELDLLRAQVETMDSQGSRGVGALQLQVSEIIKDLAELRTDTRRWQEAHERQHDAAEAARVTSRRFAVTTATAVIALLIAIIGILLTSPVR